MFNELSAEATYDPQSDLERVRAILLGEDNRQLKQLADKSQLELEKARAEIVQLNRLQAEEITYLRSELQQLQETLAAIESSKADKSELVPEIQEAISNITEHGVKSQRDDMAKAFGAIMAESTRIQIDEDRDEMIQALHPIMLPSINSAVRDAIREFQRQVDERIKQARASDRGRSLEKRLTLRRAGVSEAEANFRNNLPFQVDEIFLIQNMSGLLIGHYSAAGQDADSDLISAMLTAIRQFANDAFMDRTDTGDDSELNEVQYGDRLIIVKSGSESYCAVAIKGTEPEGVRGRLQQFIVDLHSEHRAEMRDYTGDPATISDFQPKLEAFAAEITKNREAPTEGKNTLGGTIWKVGLGMSLLSLLVLCGFIFQLWFNFRLLPVAMGDATYTSAIVSELALTDVLPRAVPVDVIAVHIEPDGASRSLFTIDESSSLFVLSESNGWILVRGIDGQKVLREGWVLQEQLTITLPNGQIRNNPNNNEAASQ